MRESSAPGSHGSDGVMSCRERILNSREERGAATTKSGRHPDASGSVRKNPGQNHVREAGRKPREDGVLETGEESVGIVSKAMETRQTRGEQKDTPTWGGTWGSSASSEKAVSSELWGL